MKAMKILINIIYVVFIVAVAGLTVISFAQDDSQAEMRINPKIDIESDNSIFNEDVVVPTYINRDANHIEMNGADWSSLVGRIENAAAERVDIVHIGDSHLQADMATALVREKMCRRYGSAGRGLVIPFKMAGTNEPTDYVVRFDCPVESSRLLSRTNATTSGFTGIRVSPTLNKFNLSLSSKDPFDSIELYYDGDSPEVDNLSVLASTPGRLLIKLPAPLTDVDLAMKTSGKFDLYGVNLQRGCEGVTYHVIGNNGACYSSYNRLSGFFEGLARLSPRLVILSLGTNEAFGRVVDSDLRSEISRMVYGIKSCCPETQILLTTPAECQKRQRTGRRRRRRTYSYAVNTNVNRVRKVILEFARDNNLAVYDFYKVAGGEGASFKWLGDKKMSKDRVHLLRDGYLLQGTLFSEALREALNTK